MATAAGLNSTIDGAAAVAGVGVNSGFAGGDLQLVLNVTFFIILLLVISGNPRMFIKRHGRYHALLGSFHLSWLILGFVQQSFAQEYFVSPFIYDIVLGVSGTGLALTAAHEFQHKNVTNFASGTLDEHATVTYGEMIEHSFYQGLNLLQAIYLHLLSMNLLGNSLEWRVLLCVFVSSPWLLRQYFPINKFSDNYDKIDDQSTTLVRLLYRIKKWQYVFYKHFLLHGLIISVAFVQGYDTSVSLSPLYIALDPVFRSYWLLLNTSYVMEFFLQTLVKKGYMNQQTMLTLQLVLMTSASISSVYVLYHYVDITVALVSMGLNFIHRKEDFLNTLAIVTCLVAWFSW
jgi:hypothetical protein